MRAFLLLAFLSSAVYGSGQSIRINLMGGLANYSGELQPSALTFNQSNAAFGAGASLDLSSRFMLRGEYMFTKLGADDKLNNNAGYRSRNLNFKTFIQELSLIGEYSFRNMYDNKVVPYVFAGIGVFKFSPYTVDSAFGKQYLVVLNTEGQGLAEYPDRKPYKTTQFNIPVGGGVKYILSDDVHLGFEFGMRALFTDYLDDVSTTYVDENTLLTARGPVAAGLAFRGDEVKTNPQPYPAGGTMRGSPGVKDYYYYGLARLSIRMNWFENSQAGGRKNKLGCPTRVL